ncbi:hypothetical protein BDV95DRAFT_231719 [Massariosphaeria phaeospora]|uniref:Uncharacterized protein n=1 Tax=Massariosphaeria phaeospora TaxID=100035 RepID=A0A7C8MHH7_9PLEO|nr:hypothetical protein BDV95DRAFT_231719 [Massariosphaeria phaeospora]
MCLPWIRRARRGAPSIPTDTGQRRMPAQHSNPTSTSTSTISSFSFSSSSSSAVQVAIRSLGWVAEPRERVSLRTLLRHSTRPTCTVAVSARLSRSRLPRRGSRCGCATGVVLVRTACRFRVGDWSAAMALSASRRGGDILTSLSVLVAQTKNCPPKNCPPLVVGACSWRSPLQVVCSMAAGLLIQATVPTNPTSEQRSPRQ